MHLMIWDLLKMLATAVLCGLLVSIAAAGITLLLTGSAEARRFQKESDFATVRYSVAHAAATEDGENDQPLPTPGTLRVGDGCEQLSLTAIERDWQVRVDGKQVHVRVMQTFQLPAETAEAAIFHVQLIKGARMQSFAAQSSTKEWTGQVISADEYARLTPTEYLTLSRSRILAAHSPRGTVKTSPILGLNSEDVITIEYTYMINLDPVDGISALTLPLAAADEYAGNGFAAVARDAAFSPSSARANRPTIRGAVWVEFIGGKPTRLINLPADADLEISNSRIDGFSWATGEIPPGSHFRLAWAS